MLLLPAFNAVLQPCAVGPTAFRAHAQGHFCGSCQRVVQDFGQSANPVADLAAARAAAPDGRVCGSFRAAQVLAPPPPPTLTRRLEWFLVALVLVLGQGLTAREALAQVQDATIKKPPNTTAIKSKRQEQHKQPAVFFGVVVEDMPSFRGGGMREVVQYIQQQIIWPTKAKTGELIEAEGRVFASFTIGTDGKAHDPKIVKGLQPLFDAEVIRVLRAMSSFKPGRQNGKSNAVSIMVPITFKRE